ncbi:DNA/RNA non-specific endonuclease [Reichenbachiella faecimaris]|uniref:DNA/RNA non-specific endonuclease n=1 Tax=Reichenbachiella faecimaris TaxID=692418 RepID=A0A1W2GNG1_REIFA|nr:DNA/RNA non-specific endonuclease [Reichenbachiella faecimaris]SMD37878.1 DNA/RNA non-specific endonuclease [Reichenbachiella faecimaris]
MAKARKGKSKSSNGKGSGVNGSSIFAIVAILVLVTLYWVKQDPDWSENLDKITSTVVSTKNETKDAISPIEKKTEATPTTSSTKKKQSEPVEPKREKFEENKINAQNGVVETVKTNENLPVYNEDDNYYYSSSFDFTWPAYTQNDPIVEHEFYTLKYNEKTEQADWVAYTLKKVNLDNAKFKRTDNFREDPDVKTKSAALADYKGSGYEPGFFAPFEDFAWSKNGVSECFFMSNIAPHELGFNQGIWKDLEKKVRQWAVNNKEIFVVTGPIHNGKSEKIGKNKVVVPSHYFKVILEMTGKEIKGIGFVFDNKKTSKSLESYAMSIDQVEEKTGLDFFPGIPDQLEKRIEQTYSYALWK